MDLNYIDRVIRFRHQVHQKPEIAFQQYGTRGKIKQVLHQFGVEEEQMFSLQPTALFVDLRGKGKSSGSPNCIAFRADMDALPMTQANFHLSYRSKNEGRAHMCGHDGHMACLIAFASKFMKHISEIPNDKMVRLLFQPSEEGEISGAKKMIEDGCLEGVDQVYGFHQWPTAPVGQLWCKQGPVMSEITIIEIKIIGTSGHGSQPQKVKNSLKAAIPFYDKIIKYLDKLQQEKSQKFISTFPVFQAGQRYNVISQSVFISGSIRSFEEGLKDVIIKKIVQQLEEIKADGFKYQFNSIENCPITSNTKLESEHVLRVGKKFFGENKVGSGRLPFRASEDFAFFTKAKPGAFFFLSSASSQNHPMLHNCNFDFNDSLIQPASQFWWELAKDRLNI